MSQAERLAKLRYLLDEGRWPTRPFLLDTLRVSPATLKRDRMNEPVVFDRERRGWRLDPAAQLAGTRYELPGLWLSAEEIHALLTMQHVLAHLDTGGLLGPHIAPLTRRRIVIDYHGRSRNQRSQREVSPQRLIHYRDNW